jgi:HlyD family secretion protein
MKKAGTNWFYLLLSAAVVSCGGVGDEAGEDAGAQAVTLFTETGNLQAVSSTGIVMPWHNWSYGRPQITFLETEGTIVKQGDVVVILDKAGVMKALDDTRAELEVAQADLNSMKINQATEMEKLNSDLRQRLSRYRQAQIDTQRVAYESQSKKTIKLLELENARITVDKARRKLETTALVQEQERKIQQARIEQTIAKITTAERTIESYTLTAPAAGMVVYSTHRFDGERRKVQVGDNLHTGRPIVQLPDMSRMKAETWINETDISKVVLGQRVRVRLDAYPRKVFDGKITYVSYICHRKNRNSDIKVFDVEVLVDGDDRILKPGMTVSCEFLSSDGRISAGQFNARPES